MSSTDIPLGGRRVLGAGLGLLEGPAWHDGVLYFVAVSRGLVWRWDGTAFVEHAHTGGGPNGLAFDANGVLWVAQNGGTRSPRPGVAPAVPSVQRVDTDGSVTTVEHRGGPGLDAPNDIAVASDGSVWFTDPPFDPVNHTPLPGRLWRLDPATGDVTVVDEGILFPNGLAFAAGGTSLLVVETGRRRILRYALDGAGAGKPVVHADLEHGEPDGMCLDAEGRAYVANGPTNDLAVVEPDGTVAYLPLAGGPLGEGHVFPTNCCFGGPDLRTLFVTVASGGRLMAFDASVPGLPLTDGASLSPQTPTHRS